jgi:hypothetical protein
MLLDGHNSGGGDAWGGEGYYSPKAWFSSVSTSCTLDVMSLESLERVVASTPVPWVISMIARRWR